MASTEAFHSRREIEKFQASRVYHDHEDCPSGAEIQMHNRLPGTGGFRLCDHCRGLNAALPLSPAMADLGLKRP